MPKRKDLVPYLLVAPALLALALTVAYPIAYNVYISFFSWNMLQSPTPTTVVGLGNYVDILNSATFLNSMSVTLRLTLLAVAIEFLLGLTLALVLTERVFGRSLLRTVLILPLMATPLVIGLIFRLIWHSDFGVANYFLSLVGLPGVAWLSGERTAFTALLITEVWHNTSFVFLILLGALQMLPSEPFEAATVDGASYWQRFWHLTLPMLRPAILVALLFRVVFTIRLFDEVWALTRGGPQGATETISMLIYKTGFQQFRVGYSASLSILLLLLTAVLAWSLVRLLYQEKA